MNPKLKVQIVYRNYKPLHQTYYSFVNYPPENVEYIIPQAKPYLKKLFPIYKKFGDNAFVKMLAHVAQKLLFDRHPKQETKIDLYHYLQMLPSKLPDHPFIVDIEHATALANFSKPDKAAIERIFNILNDQLCRGIIPLSEASKTSLENFLGKDKFDQIENKITVVYPAMPNFLERYKDQRDYSIIHENDNTFKLLFVGNEVVRKGLLEVLEAFERINNPDMKLYVVSDAAEEIKAKYNNPNIIYLDPKFPKEEFIKKIWINVHVFVMPTHSDTFGMVYLDALSCGVPVIATSQFAVKEMIQDNVNGVVVNSDMLYLDSTPVPDRTSISEFTKKLEVPEEKLIEDLVKKINLLYSNPRLVEQLGIEGVKLFLPGGKFSIDTRNSKLIQIYNKAISS